MQLPHLAVYHAAEYSLELAAVKHLHAGANQNLHDPVEVMSWKIALAICAEKRISTMPHQASPHPVAMLIAASVVAVAPVARVWILIAGSAGRAAPGVICWMKAGCDERCRSHQASAEGARQEADYRVELVLPVVAPR